ncbi:MAG: ACP S-malonyltransferase [Parvularculaceae bacterium]
MARAFVFPGQGSQFVGMGESLAQAFPVAREAFEEVDDALDQHLSTLMWEGPMETLSLTANAQPALMAHSVAMARVLTAEAGVDLADAAFVAGHSLGEYSALCAAGGLGLAATARLLRVRGEAMQDAVPAGEGGMAALIGVDLDGAAAAIDRTLEKLAAEGFEEKDRVLEIANDNAPGQVVVSGRKAAVDRLVADAKSLGVKMAKALPVSAPFHSSLMVPAAERMETALAGAKIVAPRTSLVANVTAAPVSGPDDIKKRLVEQVTGRVRWTESVRYMTGEGVDRFVELGAGKVLAGLLRRIEPDAKGTSLGEPGDIDGFLKS